MKDSLLFAVDFDGTIAKPKYPDIGEELPGAVQTMKDLQAEGHKIIIWTCRCEPYISPMSKWLSDRGFVPDAVNSNLAFVPAFAFPKILADVYIDDLSFPPFTNWADVRKYFLEGVKNG